MKISKERRVTYVWQSFDFKCGSEACKKETNGGGRNSRVFWQYFYSSLERRQASNNIKLTNMMQKKNNPCKDWPKIYVKGSSWYQLQRRGPNCTTPCGHSKFASPKKKVTAIKVSCIKRVFFEDKEAISL